jgi:phage shock protein C
MSDRLFRSRDDRMLAGVAGGLAEMWDADPALVRLVWALLVIFTGGLALLVYIVMAIVVPEEDDVVPGGMPAAWPGTPPTPATSSTMDATTTETTATPTGDAVASPASAPLTGSGWVVPPPTARQARAEARAARRAARQARGEGISGGLLLGGLLVLLGLFFLVRQYLPSLDFEWFWPVVLVGLGVVLLLSAVGRGPRSGDQG